MARNKSTPVSPLTKAPKEPLPGEGPSSAGQSGDIQGLDSSEDAENESVVELMEEGQYYEASVVDGVENAPDADAGPVRAHKRPEDDLRPEYTDRDLDEPKE
jgi:hypothetical protein